MGMVIPASTCFLTGAGEVSGCDPTAGVAAAPLRLEPPPPVKPAVLEPKPIIVPAPGIPSPDTSAASRGEGDGRGRNSEGRDRSARR